MLRQFQYKLLAVVLLFGLAGMLRPTLVQAHDKDRPFFGQASGSVVDQIPPNGLMLAYTGNATHLGFFSRTETIFANPDGSFVGQLVFCAANGDKLYANISGQFTSATTAIGQYQFVGGTGRFGGATGQADFEVVTPDGIHVDAKFSGRIRY